MLETKTGPDVPINPDPPMDIDEVRSYVGGTRPLDPSTIYKLIRTEGFPTGFLIGPQIKRWRKSAVDKWLDERPAGMMKRKPRAKVAKRKAVANG